MKNNLQRFQFENLQIILTLKNKRNLFILFGLIIFFNLSAQVYVSPNQPGRAGYNSGLPPANYNSVVTTTYYGTDATFTGQGALIAADKNPGTGNTNVNAKVIHYFKGYPSDAGYSWYTSPFTATDGNIYGDSYYGGANNWGGVYKYNVAASNAATCGNVESLIYSQGSGSGAAYGNYANMNEISNGKLVIPETAGGTCVYGKLTTMDKTGANATNIHDFCWAGGSNPSIYSPGAKLQPGYSVYGASYSFDGAYPYGFPVEGPDGYLYGTTLWGGLGGAAVGYGTVYKVKPDGTGYQILAFGSTVGSGLYKKGDGSGASITQAMPFAVPWGNVAFDKTGTYAYFFGGYINFTTYGNVCRVKVDGTEPVQIVHVFTNTSNTDPYYLYRGPLIVDDELFGTSYYGGTGFYGTAWKINLATGTVGATGKNSSLQVLHNFSFTDGAYPYAGLIYDGTDLYGSTQQGGYTGTSYGTVYKMKKDGTGFQTLLNLDQNGNACTNSSTGASATYFAYYVGAERVTLADLTPASNACAACVTSPTAACTAGSAAPMLSVSTLSNLCPAATANLTSITASNLPSGSTLTWHTGTPATTANKVTGTTAGAGTFYGAFYDSANNCYSNSGNGTSPVSTTITTCSGNCNAGNVAPTVH